LLRLEKWPRIRPQTALLAKSAISGVLQSNISQLEASHTAARAYKATVPSKASLRSTRIAAACPLLYLVDVAAVSCAFRSFSCCAWWPFISQDHTLLSLLLTTTRLQKQQQRFQKLAVAQLLTTLMVHLSRRRQRGQRILFHSRSEVALLHQGTRSWVSLVPLRLKWHFQLLMRHRLRGNQPAVAPPPL
jgi:hypothetical protein